MIFNKLRSRNNLISMKKKLLLLLISGIILLTSLVIFIKSQYFLNHLEDIAGRGVGGSVEIGSLSFENWHRLTVKGLVIKGARGDSFELNVPRLVLTFRLQDLLRRHVGGIIMTGPDLSITFRKEKAPEAGDAKGSLPFILDTLSLIEGRINIHHEKGRSFHAAPVNLSLKRDTRTGRTSLSANAFINDLNSALSLDAIIDMEKLNVESARVDAPLIDLEMLSGLPFFSFIKDTGLKGTAGLEAVVVPQNTGVDHTQINAALSVSGLSSSSGVLRINLGERLLNITFKGAHHRASDRIDIDALSVELSHIGLWTAGGKLERVSSGNPDLNLTIKGAGTVLKEISSIVSGPAVKWLTEIAVSGSAGADVSVTGSLKSPEVKGIFTLSGESFKAGNILLDYFELSLPLDYSGGSFIVKDVSAAVKDLVTVPRGTEETGIRVHNLGLLLPRLEYRGPGITSGVFQVTADMVSVMAGEKEYYREKGIILKGGITGDTEGRRLRFVNLSLDTDFIKNAAGRVSVSMTHPAAVDADLDYKDIDIEKFARLFSGGLFQRGGASVRGQGMAHAGFRITFPEKNAPRVYGTLKADFKNGGFSSADETVIAEGMKVDISGRFEFPVSLDSIDFSVSAEAGGFELLAGRFYGDFSDRPVHCMAEGRYTKADDKLNIVSAKLSLAGIGDLLMKGTVSGPGGGVSVDTDIELPDLSGGEAFDFFIRETFREQYPFLSRMRIGGHASMGLNVRGSFQRFEARGNLHIAGMEIMDMNSGNSVTGVNIFLPFDISFPEALPARVMNRFGSLTISEIKWPPLQLSGFKAFPAIGSNTLVFKEDIRMPLYSGSVTLRNVSYRDILSPRRKLRLAADVDGIDLEQVGKALDIPGFSGSVKGTIPSASFAENILLTEGEIVLELFDGTIKISGFSADNVFSPIASVRSDIELDGINLGALTRAFEFSHISGIMRGELNDLVIVNGQAQRFKGYLETYRKKGVKQRISVEALKKISILGTGSSASVLDRGIYSFFREYRYEKIGFRAALRNDNLLLLGVAGDGNDSQYLVKGGLLPPKVDVITYNQNISFKEMVSRLKRISQIEKKGGGD